MAKGKKSAAALRREALGYEDRPDPVISARNRAAALTRHYGSAGQAGIAQRMREQAAKRAFLEARLLREYLAERGVSTLGASETCLRLVPECIQAVAQIMFDGGVDPKARINAARTIVEWSHIFGELPEPLRPQTRDVDELAPADLDTMIADLKALRDRKAAAEAAAAQVLDKALDAHASDVPVTLDANPLSDEGR